MEKKTLLLLAVTLVVMVVYEVAGECCPSSSLTPNVCRDCTRATPCCGHGKCNMFCCACSGGCRQGKCESRLALFELLSRPAVVFSEIDVNGDSTLDIVEFEQRAKLVTLPPNATRGLSEAEFIIKEFVKMDKNRDGKISPGEFDEDLL